MRRIAWSGLVLLAVGAGAWLLARPTGGGAATLPWRGPLTALYWRARLRSDLPPLWCGWFDAAPGDHPMQDLWGNVGLPRSPSDRPPTRLTYALGRVATRAPTMCVSVSAPGGRGVRVDIDRGEVFHYSRHWSGPTAAMDVMSDSIRQSLDAHFGLAVRCWSRLHPRGFDADWVWRAPDYTLVLMTWRPPPGARADFPARVQLAAVLTRSACRAV